MPRRSRIQTDPGSGKFENLYRLLPVSEFEDFNWTTSLDYLERPSGDWIARSLARVFKSGDRRQLEPYLEDTIARTLAPSSCDAFFRKNAEMPFTKRDYYLSKAFQFLYAALALGAFDIDQWDAGERLIAVLEEISDESLSRLHEIFSMEHFFLWTRPFNADSSGLLASLRPGSFLEDYPPSSPTRRAHTWDGARLAALYEESEVPWKIIAAETSTSERRLYELAYHDKQPSEPTRKRINEGLSRILKRRIRL